MKASKVASTRRKGARRVDRTKAAKSGRATTAKQAGSKVAKARPKHARAPIKAIKAAKARTKTAIARTPAKKVARPAKRSSAIVRRKASPARRQGPAIPPSPPTEAYAPAEAALN